MTNKLPTTNIRLFLLLILALNFTSVSAQIGNSWQLYQTTHPTDELIVAVHIDHASGQVVDKTGTSDVTSSFQAAIDAMHNAGGGVIYVPEGKYRFDGNLVLKEGVSLRGDFIVPGPDNAISGTLFEVYSGRNDENGPAFITLRGSARIDGIHIWYPEQLATAIIPYPATIHNLKNEDGRFPKHFSQVNCVNLINSYFGINIGTVNTALPNICHIYGSPLKVGLRMNENTDVSRIIDIHFTPDYWAWSGLPNAPASDGAHAAFMLAEGIGIDYLRSDNGFNGFWEISGYKKGLVISYRSGGPFYGIEIENCVDGFTLSESNMTPLCFSNCIFEGSNTALVLDDLTGSAQFFNTDFRSSSNSVNSGINGADDISQVSFHSCNFEATANLSGLITNISNSNFNFEGEHIVLSSMCKNAVLVDNTYTGDKKVTDNMPGAGRLFDRDMEKTYQEAPEYTYVPFIKRQPSKAQLYLANSYTGVRSGDGVDDAPGLQNVLTIAGNEGGGIVFLNVGEYNIKTPISIPDNVELRGVLDNPHHTRLLVNRDLEHEFGTHFVMEHSVGNDSGASITLNNNSGVRGISMYYPKQTIYATGIAIKHPWLFKINGDNAYIKNISAANPYQLIDNASTKTDAFLVENIFSYPLTTGIHVGGGSTNTMLRYVHYNNHAVGQTYFPNDDDKEEMWTHKKLELFKFGDTENLEMLFCFGRQCNYGVVLDNENGKGPHGISIGFGVEDIPLGATLKALGNKGFQFVNASLLAEGTTVDFDTEDSLSLFNSRTKNSEYFFKSGGKGGSLYFNQVLHRAQNTNIEANGDHLEVVNSIFYTGMRFHVNNNEYPHVFYGGFLKSGDIIIAAKSDEVSWSYLPEPYEQHSSIKLNLDLFLQPDLIEYDPGLLINTIEKEAFRGYPNPAFDYIRIDAGEEEFHSLRVFDMQGKIVFESRNKQSSFNFHVSEIGESGVYLIQAIVNGQRRSKKIQIL
jgi:hypothetical protein